MPPLPWLMSDEAAEALAQTPPGPVTPATVEAMRRRLGGSPERASAVLDLVELRARGAKKFTLADRMFFTRRALEQATDEWIARYKAQRFAGRRLVVDACCGIGGDLLGFAGAGARVLAIDADPALSAYAQHNAALYGVGAEADSQRLDAENLPACDAWHADPDRRVAGRRTTRPEAHEPSLETLEAWRRQAPAGAIKLAPAARLPERWLAETELEWISRAGECRQLVAWCGPLAGEQGVRRATRVHEEGEPATFVGAAGLAAPVAPSLGEWVYDFDPVVLAADLAGALAERHGVEAVAPRVAYYTGADPLAHGLAASFRVVDVTPLHRKRLAAWVAQRGVGTLEIKCRGVDVRPEALRRELKPRGDASATLLVYPGADGKTWVVIAERAAAPR